MSPFAQRCLLAGIPAMTKESWNLSLRCANKHIMKHLIINFFVLIYATCIFTGCAPSPLIELPSTIPVAGTTIHYAFGRAPIPGGDTTNTTSAGDERLTVADMEGYLPLGRWFIWGMQAGIPAPSASNNGAGPFSIFYPFYAWQYSTSLSVKPVPYAIASVWIGSRFLDGPVGGVEAMTGNEYFSMGGGWAEIEEVRSIPAGSVDDGWAYLIAHPLGYGRIAVGWEAFQLDAKVGYGPGNKDPWMWQFSIGLKFARPTSSPHPKPREVEKPKPIVDEPPEGPESH